MYGLHPLVEAFCGPFLDPQEIRIVHFLDFAENISHGKNHVDHVLIDMISRFSYLGETMLTVGTLA